MFGINVNYLVVFIAAVASMAVGFLWYSPILFGKPWLKLMGISNEQAKGMKSKANKAYALSFIGALITSYVLAVVLAYMGMSAVADAIQTGFWLWLGFIAPVMFTSVLFENKPVKLYCINAGYQLTSLITMAIILTLWA
ncbi:MAG: hypothetical protein A3J69_01550 [Candidatus Levybacteria bacterium RIFCSPHIGHO2_02_FULL_42_12]|nr:MAG: hypothetical protein A3J69_01550 [Candidatus Levybacteria bacterium RIFCSPHIGHO2_02_FULL_42_12]